MPFPYQFSDDVCFIFVNGKPYHFNRESLSNSEWAEVMDIVDYGNDDDVDSLLMLIQPQTGIERAVNKINAAQEDMPSCVVVTVEDDSVLFNGIKVDDALTKMILKIQREGLDLTRWLLFAENVYANPMPSAREELFLWLQDCQMPITDDGHFLAYKRVRGDYLDIHSGTIDNSIGNVVEMDRSKVDPNRYNLCSSGLHFCSRSYLPVFSHADGGKILILKINPADVVAIPSDYNNAKGRCWRYTVIGEVPDDTFAQGTNYRTMVSGDEINEDWFADELGESEEVIITEKPSEYIKRVAEQIEIPNNPLWQRIIKRLKGE